MSGISLIETLFRLVMCHLVGDYVLQIDFIAKTKGENWYHLIVHCLLYSAVLSCVWIRLADFCAAGYPYRCGRNEGKIQKD